MKKIIGILAAIAALACTACDKEVQTPPSVIPGETDPIGSKIEIAFDSPTGTRAFGGGTTEVWEKTISGATVLVFNETGNIKFRRDLSALEITNAKTTPVAIVVPDVQVGKRCDFVVVANRAVPTTITTKTALLAAEEADAAAYNGTFVDVTSKAVRPLGFAMTGIASQTIVEGTTTVTITLKRTVAKVEISAATTAAFTAKYGPASVTINKMSMSRGALKSYLMDQAPAKYAAGGSTFSQEQVSSSGKNLFYIFEKATAAAGARVLLTMVATYDADGSSATTDDRIPLTYEVELTGATGGQILRNGAYFVSAAIDGLTGKDVALTINISDWETLITQSVNVGS